MSFPALLPLAGLNHTPQLHLPFSRLLSLSRLYAIELLPWVELRTKLGGRPWPSYGGWSTRLRSARTAGIGTANRWTLYETESAVVSIVSRIQ